MKHIIGWFVGNPVAANLLMTLFIAGGLISVSQIRQEEIPTIDLGIIEVTVPYPGAAPEEVQSGVSLRIEEAIDGIQGIKHITSISREGRAKLEVELESTDNIKVFDEVKSQVDAIDTFPAETERPVVSLLDVANRALEIVVFGNADERTIKELAQQVREEVAALDGISQVEVAYVRLDEVSIEVSEQTLREFGLTFDQVADAVRRSSLDIPGGSIRSGAGEIVLRTLGQAYREEDFRDIVVLSRSDGARVRLHEIATIRDGFREGDTQARFDGWPAAMVKVYQVGDEDVVEISEKVRVYLEQARARLPEGIDALIWQDEAEELKDRIDILLSAAASGLALVLLLLALCLRFRLAFWVAAGIPIALLGAIAVFGAFSITLSVLSVTALILVLGIIVDDAVVVGERVFDQERQGNDPLTAAVEGTAEVAVPVIFGVLTTMAAFMPLMFIQGAVGQAFAAIGYVAIICLAFSVLESQLILPAHLAHRRRVISAPPRRSLASVWQSIQEPVSRGLEQFAQQVFGRVLERVLEWRYVTLTIGAGILAIIMGAILGGRLQVQFMPSVEGDAIVAQLEMPEGSHVDDTARAARRIEAAAEQLKVELDKAHPDLPSSLVQHVFTSVGQPLGGRIIAEPQSHLAEVVLAMLPVAQRGDLSLTEVTDRWRELTGPIYDSTALTFSNTGFSAGDPISIRLQGRNMNDLSRAAAELRGELARFSGVRDVSDSFRSGKQEVRLSLRPEARELGLTLRDLGRQVRQAFYGEEVQRVQRGSEDVRIMVRYPEDERRSLGNLEDMYIRNEDGTEIPFLAAADVALGRGHSAITRVDRQNVVTVRADVDRSNVTPEAVVAALEADTLPRILAKYHGVSYALTGEREERDDSFGSLLSLMPIALIVIFALLAIPLRSYTQPLLIMSVIPFGAVGAVVGHLVMGKSLVFPSLLGLISLTGVVVNASLILVDYVNRQRRAGADVRSAVQRAAIVRFRPIVITSATTFAGLMPLMFNDNPATSFVVPMAISLAWGIVFATGITLFLIPCLYLVLEDIMRLGRPVPAPAETAATK